MRHGWWAGLVIALGVAPLAAAETLEPKSNIVAVTVFPDRALVTRQAALTLTKGVHAVTFASLPGTIEAQSISAKGEGEAKVTLFGAKLITTQLEAAQSPRIKDLEEQIRRLEDQRQQLHGMKGILDQEWKFLSSIQAASSEQLGKDIMTKQPSATDLASLMSFLDQQLMAITQKSHQADGQQRDLEDELSRLQRELARLQGEERRQQTAIVVELEARTAGTLTLEVSYRLSGATWQPIYEARASAQADHVQWIAYGLIRQRTGEEWNKVRVSLSTAKPAIGGRMPEIQPWWLTKSEPIPYNARGRAGLEKNAMMRSVSSNAPSASDEFEEALKEGKRKEPATLAQATVETRGPAVVFSLPQDQTIASDWQPRKAAIATATLPASFSYETTPRLSPYAYLRAKVTNNSESVFLSGEVQVFLDEAFVATSSVDVVGPSEQFDLFLGIDERIRVERKTVKAKVAVSLLPGLHGKIKTIDADYLTTIQNFRSSPATITLIDQLPVAQHDEITVEPIAFEPKPTDEDKEKPGVYRWMLTIPAGAKQAVRLSYRVKHPVDFIVDGF